MATSEPPPDPDGNAYCERGRVTRPAAERLLASLLAQQAEPRVRLLACGSVDDGKSTLLGRLLLDSGAVLDDQLAAVRAESERRGAAGGLDLAWLVDGLRAEREQGITIDVAWRHLFTPRRRFLLIDAPGHEQYTRNMASGASLADVALLLVDAQRGVRPQTLRHLFLASLLGTAHVVVAVNKMDLCDFDQDRFATLRTEIAAFAARLRRIDLHCIPVCAVAGDNVVRRSTRMPWYEGSTLLEHLETVHVGSDHNLVDLRLPVQGVARGADGERVLLGTLAGGVLRVGDQVVALPSGVRGRVATLRVAGRPAPDGIAFAPMAVGVTLADEVDIGRGQVLAHVHNLPRLTSELEAMVLWFADEPLAARGRYLVKHCTFTTPAEVVALRYRLDPGSLHREECTTLSPNDVGRVRLRCAERLACDAYERNRTTGAFLVIDEVTGATVGAGMVLDRLAAEDLDQVGPAVEAAAATGRISAEARARRLGQRPFAVWLTGADAAARAHELEELLFRRGLVPHVVPVAAGDDDVAVRVAATLLEAGLVAIVAAAAAASPPTDVATRLGSEDVIAAPASEDAAAVFARLAASGWLARPE